MNDETMVPLDGAELESVKAKLRSLFAAPPKANGVSGHAKAAPRLSAEHVELLRARGIPLDLAEAAGLHTLDAAGVTKVLGLERPYCGGLAIPYAGADPPYVRVRMDRGDTRYLCPKGRPVPVYRPPAFDAFPPCPKDLEDVLVVVEAPLKALAMTAAGLNAVGLGGVDTTLVGGKLDPSWGDVGDKDVRILFDENLATSERVQSAALRLRGALEGGGGRVGGCSLPRFTQGGKAGPDDYLVQHGREALFEVVRTGKPASPEPADPSDPLASSPILKKLALVGQKSILEAADRPIVYVWQGIIEAGTITLLAGSPSSGKTTLLFLLLAARLASEPTALLGRVVTPKAANRWIVIIEGEHGEASACRKLRRVCRTMGVPLESLDRVILLARKAVLIGSPAWQEVAGLVAAGLVSDIALDTISRVAPGDSNSEEEQVAIFDHVARCIEGAPSGADMPSVWAVGHRRKRKPGDNADSSIDDVLGSIQRVGQADNVAIIEGVKADGGRTVSSTIGWPKLREDDVEHPPAITYSLVRNDEGYWSVEIVGEADDTVPLETQVERQLAQAPLTKTALGKALGRSDSDIETGLANLFSAGHIETTWLTVRGVKRKHFKLRQRT